MKKYRLQDLILAGLFIALAQVMPFVTAQIPSIGQLLTPMHFPIIIAAFILGPGLGLLVGFVSPLLRMLMFAMPPFPISLIMAFELATYGLLVGLLSQYLKRFGLKDFWRYLIALLVAMIAGRIVYTLVGMIFLEGAKFGPLFVSLFTLSWIGVLLQIVLIPMLMLALRPYLNQTSR